MSFDYSGLAATASELIEKFGKASVYIRSTAVSSSDPVAGTVTAGTPVNLPVNAVEIDYNEKYQPGATIQATDRMYAIDAQPGLDDMLIIDDEQWEIVQVWPKKPGDTFIAAFAQVRA